MSFFESLRELRRERDALRREISMARELIVVQDIAFERQQKKLERAIDENLSLKEHLAEIESCLGGIVGGEEAV
ncbi:hypothetical protein L2W58_03550 [Dethiosulfovibrio sp. F2B]|uniref:hypothetical protein n=1 Tax=Dethiosulfovibrio faecalis TaxID=2720018 RepID=UPI001F240C73|nr:hypothetical protein [Dethiosulfovibrio faecalis]MCF4150866.1 hypothetical protein [Dethiosulfovibrio faecalis]